MKHDDRKVWYEPHPVKPERKAELMAAGYRILDSVFAPPGWVPEDEAPPQPSAPAAEDVAALFAKHEELFGSKAPQNMKPENLAKKIGAELARREEAAKKAAEGGGQQ